MIKQLTTPTVNLQISAMTIVKITTVATATSIVVRIAAKVVTPYLESLADKVTSKVDELEEKIDNDEVEEKNS